MAGCLSSSHLVPQGCLKGPVLVLGQVTSSLSAPVQPGLSGCCRIFPREAVGRSVVTCEQQFLLVPGVHCSKKVLCHFLTCRQPQLSELVHHDPVIQNVDGSAGSYGTPMGVVVSRAPISKIVTIFELRHVPVQCYPSGSTLHQGCSQVVVQKVAAMNVQVLAYLDTVALCHRQSQCTRCLSRNGPQSQ